MKLTGSVYVVITLVVTIILIATLVIPVVDDLTDNQDTTAHNTGYQYLMAVTSETVTLGWDTDHATYNGESVADVFDASDSPVYVVSDNMIAIITHNGSNWGGWIVAGEAITTTNHYLSLNGFTKSATFTAGTATVTDGSNTYTATYTYVMTPAATGDYGAYNAHSGLPVYMDEDGTAYAVTNLAINGQFWLAKGTVNAMVPSISVVGGSAISNASVALVSTYDDGRYEVTDLALENVTASNTLTYLIVPIDYTVKADSSINAILGILPLLLIIVPVVVAARAISGGRE